MINELERKLELSRTFTLLITKEKSFQNLVIFGIPYGVIDTKFTRAEGGALHLFVCLGRGWWGMTGKVNLKGQFVQVHAAGSFNLPDFTFRKGRSFKASDRIGFLHCRKIPQYILGSNLQ